MHYCRYYQALAHKNLYWFAAATMRSFDHLAFERTLEPERSLIEYFVPQDQEQCFVEVMNSLVQRKVLLEYKEMPNRLQQEDQKL